MTLTHIILILVCVLILLMAAVFVLLIKQRKEQPEHKTAERLLLVGQALKETRDDVDKMERSIASGNESVKTSVNAAVRALEEKTEGLTRQSYETRLKVTESLAAMQEKMSRSDKESAEAVAAAIEKLQASNEKKLDEMRATVDEKLTGTLNKRLDASFQTVSEQLANVYRSLGEMQEMSGGITALNRVLSGVKTRGNWAETQLESLLEQIIPGMYVKNYAPTGGDEVVEFAVRIPAEGGGEPTYMPIDSKFPMEDYLRLCDASDAGDAEGVKAAKKALEARVLAQAREVHKYVCPPGTTPFAVLYLATDSLYAEVVSSKANLADRLHSELGILLAGPSTVTALLSSLAMGFRTLALNEKAGEVMKLLASAKAQYDKFEETLTSAQKSIDLAGRKLEEAQHRNSIIQKSLRSVESLSDEG